MIRFENVLCGNEEVDVTARRASQHLHLYNLVARRTPAFGVLQRRGTAKRDEGSESVGVNETDRCKKVGSHNKGGES